MDNKYLYYGLCVVAGLIIIYLLYYFIFKNKAPQKNVMSNYETQSHDVDDGQESGEENENSTDPRKQLVKKLNESGWTLYISPTCGYCHKQMDIFGEFGQDLNVIVAKNDQSNIPKGINGFPAWENGIRIATTTSSHREVYILDSTLGRVGVAKRHDSIINHICDLFTVCWFVFFCFCFFSEQAHT